MRLALLALWLFFTALAPAAAQKAATSPFTYFYLDPKPEKLAGFLDAYSKRPAEWSAYPPMAGFFALVFRRFPDRADRLSPTTFDGKTAVTVAVAYKLSGLPPMPPVLRDRLFATPPDEELQAQFTDLPARIEDQKIATPTHLDMMWGAFFASGDDLYVRKILGFLAATIDPSGEIAVNVTKLTVALNGNHSQEIFAEMNAKYDKMQLRGLAYAATAQWALASNAHQHPKVAGIVDAYCAEHPDSHAAMSLAALIKKK